MGKSKSQGCNIRAVTVISGRQLPKKYLKVFLSTEIVAGCQAAAEQRIVTHLSKSLMERCKTQKLNCIKKREIKETTVGGAFIKSNFIPASFCWVLAEAVAVGQHLGNRLYFNPVNFTHTSFFFSLAHIFCWGKDWVASIMKEIGKKQGSILLRN